MWFEELFGFQESREAVYENIKVEGVVMTSKANGRMFRVGKFTMSSLEELRRDITYINYNQKISVEEVVGNVQDFHSQRKNAHAVFQVASQFNMLEMISPEITPEQGVTRYEMDRTQGPACAIACGPATVYRNYFVSLDGKVGQTAARQLNGLEAWERFFENAENHFWTTKNGYVFFTEEGLQHVTECIKALSNLEREDLKSQLKVGVHWNTQVTLVQNPHMVTQVFCSALPLGYTSNISTSKFETVAKLILEATYEATFLAGIKNFADSGDPQLYLTLVGGGVFGNPKEWIWEAIEKAIVKYQHIPLRIKIVSYGSSDLWLKQKIDQLCNNNF